MVEIGGWNRKFTFQNPPPKFLKGEIEKYVEWMLWLAEISPKVVINSSKIAVVEYGKVVRLSAEIQNIGYLPTNITQRAKDARLNQPVRAIIELKNAELIAGKRRTVLGHIAGSRDASSSSANSKRQLEYGIKIGAANATATLTIQSDKAGIVRKVLKLN